MGKQRSLRAPFGREAAILAQRQQIYEKARKTTPERWGQNTRNWQPVETVYLNPTMRGEQTPLRDAA
ncbi:MAG: hypothetical protein HZB55_01275 [Deltaproteobacteria bacterium]|nr:hypothetical protein [Deltaproteobacteria bacterium]